MDNRPCRVLEVVETVGLGGVETLNLQVFRKLAEQPEVHLQVLAFESGPLEPEYRQAPFAFSLFHEGTRWHPRNFLRFYRRIRAFQPHLVHSHGFKATVYTALATGFLPRARLFTWHGYRALDTRRGMQWTLRLLHPRFHYALAVSNAVADLLRHRAGIPGHKILVFPNALDLTPYEGLTPAYNRPFSPNAPLILGMVGRLAEVKNYPLFLELVAHLAREFPHLEAWIVGDGPERPALEQQARELGIASRVRFWGLRRDVPEILTRMDVFVFTSHAESFGMVVLEAQAAGLPVVVSDYPAAHSLVREGETGFLARRGDLEDFLRKTRPLLASPELRRQMGLEARRWVFQHFSLDTYVQRLWHLYQRLCTHPIAAPGSDL